MLDITWIWADCIKAKAFSDQVAVISFDEVIDHILGAKIPWPFSDIPR